MLITQKELKKTFHYNPNSGLFIRKKSAGGVEIGTIAGCLHHSGYIHIKTQGKKNVAHRLAWLYMTGEWPSDQIDHINQIKNDNRWCNLRECTNAQNKANVKAPVTNSSGYKGVSRYKKRNNQWVVKIKYKQIQIHVGMFNCIHKAAMAYNKKALELFGEFAFLNKIKGEV